MRHFSSLSRPFAYLMIATVLCWQASALLGPQVAHATSDTIYEGTNTTLSGDDDYSGPFNFGFNFPFFGVTTTQAFVNINGTLNFDSGYDEYSNSGLPAGSGMGAAILPFWDDLITHNYDAQSILYKTVGSAPNREFIVQWTSMYFYNNPDVQLGTFQVILYENGGKIQLQYRDILGGTQAEGDSATIGIQKDGSTPLQYSVNDPVVHSRMAISYTPDEDTYIINDAAAYDYKYLSDADGPGTATLTSPSNAATGVSTSPTLTWSAATNTTSYKVLVATDAGFSTIVTNQSGVTDTSYGLSGLDPGTTYYWRIEADNSSGSALSDSFSFTTGAANQNPTDPTSLSPSTLTGSSFISQSTLAGTPFAFTLADPDSGQQVKYQIQINSSNDFASPLISYTSALAAQGASTFTFGQAAGSGTYTVGSASTTLSDGNYYWRVRTIDDATAVSGWSAPSGIAFKLDTTAPALGTVTATNSGSTATFSWDTATDAGSGLSATPYTLQYSKSSDFLRAGKSSRRCWEYLCIQHRHPFHRSCSCRKDRGPEGNCRGSGHYSPTDFQRQCHSRDRDHCYRSLQPCYLYCYG